MISTYGAHLILDPLTQLFLISQVCLSPLSIVVHTALIWSWTSGDPTPLILQDSQDPNHEFDFSDIGIGAKHIIILTTDQRLFVIGNNANGQLGLGNSDPFSGSVDFVPEWKETRIPSESSNSRSMAVTGDIGMPRVRGGQVVGVAAGGNATFVILRK